MTFTVKQIPNAITTLRMVLAIPIFILLIQQRYAIVLWVVLVAGVSDGLDGFLARRLNAESRYGAILDPLSDKALLVSSYIAFAIVGLVPWWLTAIVLIRDLVIVIGGYTYHFIYGRFKMAPSVMGKLSTFVQIVVALLIVVNQVTPFLPVWGIAAGVWAVIGMALASGGSYVFIWTRKAIAAHRVRVGG